MSAPSDLTLGQLLLNTGWTQGVTFDAPDIFLTFNSPTKDGKGIEQKKKIVKNKLVLITQDCDLVIREDIEPYVEALVCNFMAIPDSQFLNSARYFVIDLENSLVAQAQNKVLIKKQLLENLVPDAWNWHPLQFNQFIRWLCRRYGRPAIPDEIVKVFQDPVIQNISTLFSENKNAASQFSKIVREVRIKLPSKDALPPFNLELLIIGKEEELQNGLSSEADKALKTVINTIESATNPDMVTLQPNIRLRLEEDISVAEYFKTTPINLGFFTYKGEELDGAEPFEITF